MNFEGKYAQTTHPAIIVREEFDAVQMLLGQRAKRESCHKNKSPFAQKIFCGQCGTSFRKKVSHGKVFWSCRKHNEDIQSCPVRGVFVWPGQQHGHRGKVQAAVWKSCIGVGKGVSSR
ncbi:recombinase zinc beta ribbon domain-containing protein [Pseudoflavonifractor phocaeensis]|nr:recombinase zinc beta ribbon domain-containing protein [Pseudoflavonifractor phocaeensis]